MAPPTRGCGCRSQATTTAPAGGSEVARLGGEHSVVKALDEFADVPWSSKYLQGSRPLDPEQGIPQELFVAQLKGRNNVTGLRQTSASGDIDVLTRTEAIEVKSNIDNADMSRLEAQLMNLSSFARARNLTPVVATTTDLPLEALHPDRQAVLLKYGVQLQAIISQ